MVLRDRLCVVHDIKAKVVSCDPGKLMRHISSRWPRARMQRFAERNADRPYWIPPRAGSCMCLEVASRTSYILSWFPDYLERSGIVTMVLGAMEELVIADRLLSLALALYKPNRSSRLARTVRTSRTQISSASTHLSGSKQTPTKNETTQRSLAPKSLTR